MQQDRWQQIEHLFFGAIELSPLERGRFLDRQCTADQELRVEVESLLRSHETSGFLDRASTAVPGIPPSLIAGSRLGAWQVDALIGRGGMGEVYSATRFDAAFEQRAALKLLRYEAACHADRFHAERRVLARLEHPGIARLLDGGTTVDGRPYMVMEYVEGQSLTQFCRDRNLSLHERLQLFMQVCDAVAFAHRNLVIHRDLKPDNILVNTQGGVKLLDFGIAKLIDVAALAGDADQTLAPFTADYAAPEQLSGEPVTTATDIYALGVVLFELMVGERPLSSHGLPSAQAVRLIVDREAPAPSRVAATNPIGLRFARMLKGDLDAIVAKCLRKEPGHRYETVIGLKLDIDRHLRHRPVLARTGARAYVGARFIRRHWLPLSGLMLFVVAVVAAALYANAARIQTGSALARADAVRNFVVELFQQNDPEAGNGRELTARELVDIGARRIELGFANDSDTRIELLGVSGNLYRALADYPRADAVLSRRLDQASAAYDVGDPRLMEAQLDMARVAIATEHFADAQRLLDKALAVAASATDTNGQLRVKLMRARALLETERGNSALAIEWMDRAISLMRRQSSVRTSELAEAMSERAEDIFINGQIADAEQPLRDALAMLDPNDHEDFVALLKVRQRLGVVLNALGRFDEVIPLLRANAEATRQLYGDQHPLLGNALHLLASALRRSGDTTGAIAVFREALSLYEQAYGPDHSYVAVAMTGLGQSLSAAGEHQAGIDALMRAQAIYAKTLGPQHTNTVISTIALADARLSAGDAAGAERGFREALAAFAKIGDGKHIYAEAARSGLGRSLSAQNQFVAAEKALDVAHVRLAAEFGGDDRRVINIVAELVHCLLAQGKTAQARELLEQGEQSLSASTQDVTQQRARLLQARVELDHKR